MKNAALALIVAVAVTGCAAPRLGPVVLNSGGRPAVGIAAQVVDPNAPARANWEPWQKWSAGIAAAGALYWIGDDQGWWGGGSSSRRNAPSDQGGSAATRARQQPGSIIIDLRDNDGNNRIVIQIGNGAADGSTSGDETAAAAE